MRQIISFLSVVMVLSSLYSFIKASTTDDDLKRLLYGNIGLSQLIVGTLVTSKIKEDL